MDRIQLSFPPAMLEKLRADAERRGISIAELIRRMVDSWYEKQDLKK